jgi:hypothetical protein
MPAHQSRFPVKPTLLAILLAFSAQQAIATECTWNVAAGNWAVLTNWAASCGTGNGNPAGTPGAADNATIGAAGVVTVDTAQRIGTVTNDGSLIVDASSLRVSGGITGSGSTTIQGAGLVNLEGTQTVGGNATIIFGTGANNRLGIDGGNKLVTLAAGTTIRGQSGSIGVGSLINGSGNSIVNQGLISSDSGGTIIIQGLGGGLSNQNILEATGAGSKLNLVSDINNTGGTIRATAGGTVLQQSSAVTGGTITTSAGGSYQLNNGANILSGVTLSSGSSVDMASATSLAKVNSGMTLNGTINVGSASLLNFEGDQTLSGNGNIVFGSGANNRVGVDGGNKTLTVGSGVTISGENGIIGLGQLINGSGNALVNNGTISANVAGGIITLAGLTSGITNNGTISALNGGTLQLQSNLAGGSGSQLVAGVGSVIAQQGVTISGLINTSGSGNLRPTGSGSNYLSGVTLNGNLDMASATAVERVINNLVLNGTINVNNASLLNFEGDQTLSGSGSIVFGNSPSNNRVGVDGGGKTLTVASGMTIRGENGTIGQGQLVNGSGNALVNNGTISADVAGGVITLAGLTSGLTNNGTISALNGGTLQLQSNLVGSPGGQLVAGAGSAILQQGVTISGVINTSGSGNLRPTGSGSNYLSGVTLNGNLDMASATAVERVINNLVLNGNINVNNASLLNFEGDQTLSGSGSIVFGSSASNNRVGVDGGGKTLTVASGVTIRGENGTIGLGQLVNGSGNTLVNQGLIRSDSGGTINLAGATFVNQSIAEAVGAGSVLRLDSTVDNTVGTLRSTDGGVVLQNGVTVTGGNITNSGGATYRINGSGANYLSGVTLTSGSNIDMITSAAIGRVINGMTLNGTVNLGSSSLLNMEGNQTLSGTGSIVFGAGGNNRVGVDGGNKTLTVASGVTIRGVDGSIGLGQLVNGSSNRVINNGTINSDGGGLITIQGLDNGITNNGLLRAQNGTLNVSTALSGTGTLQVDATGAVNLAAGAKSQGTLAMGAAGAALNLNTGNLTISSDYTNVGAGTGNSFNRRAGVTGTGQIVAGGDVAQVISGAAVTGGATTNATLTIGSVRVGANTFDYNIGNAGTTGPTLRGAVQTNVNGGNLTDARLSGTGITASNYSAGGPGGPGSTQSVTFTAGSAGALAPLTGQVLNLRSNFDNIADQKLNIVLAGGAAAYNAAVGSTTPAPSVTVANQHVGGSTLASLTVANTATAGAFSEDLNARFGSNTGAASNNGASINGLLAGTNNSSAMKVGVDTTSAGTKTGTVTLNYETAGAVNGVSNGLGVAAANAPQVLNVSGNVYRLAQPNTIDSINFGNVLFGSTQTRTLTVRNLAATDGFSEALNAAFGSIGGVNAASFSGAGGITGLLAGSSDSTSMVVTLNTGTTGTKTANVQILLKSNGDAIGNGLGLTDLGTQVINLDGVISGTVGNLATAGLSPTTVNFGKFREGTVTSQTQQLTVSNLTTGPGEGLNASFGVASGGASNNGGTITSLATAASNNTAMSATLNGLATAGAKSGTQTVNFVSDGSFNGGVTTPLPAQVVNLSADVYRLAVAGGTNAVNLAAKRVGDAAATGTLTLANTAAADGFSEGLRGSFGAAPAGFVVSGPASTALLAAGASEARTVTLSTATAGNFGGNVDLALVSNGAGTSGFGDESIGSKSVALAGKVYTAAVGKLATDTVDFGIVRVGDSVSTRNISVQNVADLTALNDTLRADLSGLSGGGALTAGGPVSGIVAGSSGTIAVALNTSAAGVFDKSGTVSFLSQNPDMADVSAGASGSVLVKAQVNNLANADFDLLSGLGRLTQTGTSYDLDLGNIVIGKSIAAALQLDNDVAGPADFLRGSFDLTAADDFAFTGWRDFLALGAGDALGGLELDFTAADLGLVEDTITFKGFGYNASDTAGLGQSRSLRIHANVVRDGGGSIPEPATSLLLTIALASLLLQRRRAMLH